MMYITYDTEQWEIIKAGGYISSGSDRKHTKLIETWKSKRTTLPDPNHHSGRIIPTWLVRVSDMQLVPGSSIKEGTHYHALSYSWNQSGEIVKKDDGTNKYDRIDNKRHTIISGWHKLRKHKHVSFEGIIQRICKDFNVHYIWYDQMCIDQTDTTKKQHEIQQMHHIYRNAQFTIVLVPELEYTGEKDHRHGGQRGLVMDTLLETEWAKRLWTLEESYMSRKMLFVGTNVHMWSIVGQDCIPSMTRTGHFLYNICTEQAKWNASTVLWFARARSSSKAHDWIFALVNMFPAIKDGITFRYDMPITDLTLQFYRLLIEHDQTVLMFGAPYTSSDRKALSQRQSLLEENGHGGVFSPSWTGIDGTHIPQNESISLTSNLSSVTSSSSFTSSTKDKYEVDDEGNLHVTSAAIPVTLRGPSWVKTVDVNNDIPDKLIGGLPCYPIWEDYLHRQLHIGAAVPPASSDNDGDISSSPSVTFVATTLGQAQMIWNCFSQIYRLKATHILPAKKQNNDGDFTWINTASSPTDAAAYLSLTDENRRGECIILTGIQFKMDSCIALPVVKKVKTEGRSTDDVGYYHKSIGLCFITDLYQMGSEFILDEQEFVIK
ncbi:hypothetical protein BDA99DRAFT_494344 [Phascolomyces articulosus]|uniref:Heterokaryon incompatibility domain-containing protein n=1 Tax=Phascolomyces articulosus TaxID=60185 RepID=A0AAD5PJL6_9FUNG|nr:hypothetical protein BDA99DRAFT_494344 [Phascolomyces articulosus]